jgi:hypothetical protein
MNSTPPARLRSYGRERRGSRRPSLSEMRERRASFTSAAGGGTPLNELLQSVVTPPAVITVVEDPLDDVPPTP